MFLALSFLSPHLFLHSKRKRKLSLYVDLRESRDTRILPHKPHFFTHRPEVRLCGNDTTRPLPKYSIYDYYSATVHITCHLVLEGIHFDNQFDKHVSCFDPHCLVLLGNLNT